MADIIGGGKADGKKVDGIASAKFFTRDEFFDKRKGKLVTIGRIAQCPVKGGPILVVEGMWKEMSQIAVGFFERPVILIGDVGF